MDQEQELAAANEAFDSGYDDKPTETPAAVVELASELQDDAPAPAAVETPDPLKDVLARFDKLQQSHDRLAGNLGRVQQNYEQVQLQLTAAQAAQKTVDDAPGKQAMQRAAEDPVKWAALKKEFPDWAEATEELLASRPTQVFDATAFKAELTREMQGQTQAMQEKIIDASLNAVMPGWRSEVAQPGFNTWIGSQPEAIQALRLSDDVGDAARMLKLYDAFKSRPAPAKVDAPKPDTSARTKRLAAAVGPKGSGGYATGTTEADEFEKGYSS